VGLYYASGGLHRHGFELSGGVYTSIQPPGSLDVTTSGINSLGYVAGGANGVGFVYHNGTYRPKISFPGASATGALDVNDGKQIVGFYINYQTGASEAYSYLHGAFVALDFPGANDTVAEGISIGGDIVGYYFDANNVQHGFLRTP